MELRAQDLRIGNWVKSNDINIQVDGFNIACFESAMLGEYNFSPIPLTEEILLKCGFEYTDGEDAYECIWDYKGDFQIWEHSEGYCHDYANGGDVNYLHELQNIFYCLCGKELEVNL